MANVDRSEPNDIWLNLLLSDPFLIAQFLYRYRIVSAPACPKGSCNGTCTPIRITSARDHARHRFPVKWQCSEPRCNGQRPFCFGSYLHGTHLSVAMHVRLLYKYYLGRTAGEAAAELNVHVNTVETWFSFYRRCVSNWMQNNFYPNFQFDARFATQVDEAHFIKKQKHNRGNPGGGPFANRASQKWVLGMTQTETKYIALKHVRNRGGPELEAFIGPLCPIGSAIVSDCWGGYMGLNRLGFLHYNVNHEVGFVHPFTGMHTNTMEGAWALVRGHLRKFRGIKEDNLQEYLDDYAFRRNVKQTGSVWIKLLLVIGAKQSVVAH